MRLTHFSLCTGIGGIDLAAEWAGFITVGQCEIDDYASKVLTKNFKGVKNFHDIRTITTAVLRENGIDPESITVLSAGFPCQPYSLAGKGKGDGDERDLWGEVARCIREIKPKWFVGENTPGLFARANQRYFKRILADLTEMGYSVSWGIWGAYDVGAPHKRERVFICASDTDRIRNTRQGLDNETASPTNAIRVCCTLAYTTSDELGMYGSTKEIETSTGHGFNNGVRAEKNAIGEWWKAEPDVGRVANGIPARVDKLRCLGNAVVPQQIYPLFEAIAEYEKGEKEHEKEILYG